ncbi:MAG: hypothetical protein PVJ85_15525 [Anaerolineae bacterium]|jgi:hypothetical protein
MSIKRLLLIIVVAGVVVLAMSAGAMPNDAPQAQARNADSGTIPYPGRLSDESGQPVAGGAYDFAFALYATADGGEPFWSEVQEGVTVRGGAFSVSLGSVEALPEDLLRRGSGWLAVEVRGPRESAYTALTPRQELVTAPSLAAAPLADAACPHDHFGEWWLGSGDVGLMVESGDDTGLFGWSSSYIGMIGISTPYSFVWPQEREFGVYGYSHDDHGVYGRTAANWSWHSGVFGEANQDHANGVTGWNKAAGPGVYGYSETGFAGYFDGPVYTGSYLRAASGGSTIDHPLDPASQTLNHAFVESPDMKNLYDGVVILDAAGSAWVDLPAWFEALNQDYRYQLTPIGAPGPNLYVAQEIEDNRFQIAGGEPGMKVSWQVTGTRHDPYAEANRIPVEEDKPAAEQGTYLHPEAYGLPETLGVESRWEAGR